MIETVATTGDKVTFRITVRRFGVYLDNHSIIDLAKGSAERRHRICAAFAKGADLMFSTANAAEILGPERESTHQAIADFLDGVGPNWIPLEAAALMDVLRKEEAGEWFPATAEWFLQRAFAALNLLEHGEQRLELVKPEFFRLSAVIGVMRRERTEIREALAKFDRELQHLVPQLNAGARSKPALFEKLVPATPYDPKKPATFAFNNLLRTLVREARGFRIKPGDGADLCHSVVAAAYAKFATLDRTWKRRVEALPKPNAVARIYYGPELDRLVWDVEEALARPPVQ